MIPKCIHLIWIGTNAPPWPCIDSWRKDFIETYSDWEVRIWRDADIDKFGLVNRQAYDDTAEMCGKADIARYEIVYRYGGVYIDADSVWLGRPLGPLLEQSKDTGFFCAHEGAPDLIVCGFFGSVANHPILRAVVDAIPARRDQHAGAPQWIVTGPALLGEMFQYVQTMSPHPVATVVPFELLIAHTWHGVTAAALPALVANARCGTAISFQLGYSTNELWRDRLDIGR